MNRRGKRLTLGVMAVGLAILLILGIVHREAIRMHVEAWQFQRSRKTETIRAHGHHGFHPWSYQGSKAQLLFLVLSSQGQPPGETKALGVPVIVADGDKQRMVYWTRGRQTPLGPIEWDVATPDLVRRVLAANDFRVLEQRFPRRAYVVILDETAAPSDSDDTTTPPVYYTPPGQRHWAGSVDHSDVELDGK